METVSTVSMGEGPHVTAIGFLEEADPWKLESRFFPSKVGGKPAWLDLSNLPSNDDLKCPKCRNPCVFLCQIYAPWIDVEYCFHRTLFIFLCVDGDCCEENENRTFKVFRCQFGRRNPFYPYDPPLDDENWRQDLRAETFQKLCIVCGAKGTSHCGKCKRVNYCSKQHQIVDWKTGHKEVCKSGKLIPENTSMRCLWLLPEFELVTGREEDEDDDDDSEESCSDCSDDDHDSDHSEKKRVEEFKKLVKQGKAGTFQGNGLVDKDLLRMASQDEDKVFVKFRSKIAKFPTQVLRYVRGGKPLWITNEHLPKPEDVPPCPYCKAPRRFELQVMPQMLNYLALDGLGNSVDWGVLAVYTCSLSCDSGPPYRQEFLWKQDIAKPKNGSKSTTTTAAAAATTTTAATATTATAAMSSSGNNNASNNNNSDEDDAASGTSAADSSGSAAAEPDATDN